jgi:hypothetical protein
VAERVAASQEVLNSMEQVICLPFGGPIKFSALQYNQCNVNSPSIVADNKWMRESRG